MILTEKQIKKYMEISFKKLKNKISYERAQEELMKAVLFVSTVQKNYLLIKQEYENNN